jgi:predicted O-linked N-acetylglucosamine transferase (SPINDLY family)
MDSPCTNPDNQPLGTLVMEDGNLQIDVVERELPQFILEANEAVKIGKIEEAAKILDRDTVEAFSKKLERDGCRTIVLLTVAKLLFDTGQPEQAEKWYLKIIDREPNAFVYNALGDICYTQKRISEAAEYIRKAVETDPGNQAYWLGFARALIRTGRRDEGLQILRERAARAPVEDAGAAGSILLWQLHYVPESTQAMFFEEYVKWADTYYPMSLAKTSHGNDPDPDRRLKIAYISPDYRNNVASKSFEPFLDGHNRQKFEIYGYGNVAKPDNVTERLAGKFDHYCNIHHMTVEGVASLIEEEKIDILVEIGGHCRDNCLKVLALKPAPVQVDYGGINTSGMKQIDYRLTDRVMTPPETERFYVEDSVSLPGGIFSYRPPQNSPLVGSLPARQKGHVTFGSFNNNMKINNYIMDLWAKVLNADEKSRFVMKFMGGSDEGMREYYLTEFERRGVQRGRVDIHEMLSSHFSHMQLHNEVDILLDTFPHNGCMTTMEGLWMGVPTITLVGEQTACSRAGLTILTRVGLEIFAASSADEYVAKALAFSRELDNLAIIRNNLRQIMLESSICQPKRLAGEIEEAYRMMWHRWCQVKAGAHHPEDTSTQVSR